MRVPKSIYCLKQINQYFYKEDLSKLKVNFVNTMKKTAIILGATGLTGNILLKRLLIDPSYEKVILFSRSKIQIESPKIEEHIIDLFQLDKHAKYFVGDVVFCCIGTTKAKTPDKETYRKIDFGIPVAAAKLARQNNIDNFIVISAIGADSTSSVFYNKTKGEMEEAVLEQGVKNTYVLRPSLIVGNRNERRFGESAASVFMKLFDFIIPKKYKIIKAETITEAMHILAATGYSKSQISSEEIVEIANSKLDTVK